MDMIATSNQLVFLAAPMWEKATWIAMMAASFKTADHERDILTAQGPWTARTASIQRYAGVDVYA